MKTAWLKPIDSVTPGIFATRSRMICSISFWLRARSARGFSFSWMRTDVRSSPKTLTSVATTSFRSASAASI